MTESTRLIGDETMTDKSIEFPNRLDVPAAESEMVRIDTSSLYYRVKRLMDILFAAILLVLLLPVLIVIAVIVFMEDPKGYPLLRQDRVGLNGKIFQIFKFRSMHVNTPKYVATHDLTNPAECLTRVGKVIRKASIDELPQLLNVLKGEMSFIGPRPLIPEEKDMHDARIHKGVYQVPPGITGLAQTKGRDLVKNTEKAYWDVKYIENFGLKQDLVILFTTIPKLLSADGIHEGKIENL